ncbi:histidine kinase [Flavobacterium columnare]|uniref:Signal transduction histidine kinase LytS n=4 Tax=Flavobacterium columnare TaxID=996 RepID=G8X4I5_FLACA|nr:histidine kinase [Flavobacterium columnare]AEW85410.1 signal transduction histidine kinase LytS [Flavobacterium columnare ATCC 49512]AMO19735.1 histidine kinase [Flavobacterium columnare]ANO48805.1 signal transduction histidine kinase LytS [Flavobacterium columnare]APT23167.1 histidine kinase [Flavobacterium columnare]AUX17665.1 histidine kinase [Flavobacterium columnare]
MNKWIKTIPTAILISFFIGLALLFINYLNGAIITWTYLKWSFFYAFLYGISLYYANGIVFVFFDRLFKENRFAPKRLILGGITSFSISLLMIFFLRIFESVILDNETFLEFIKNEKASNYVVSMVITLIVTLGLYLFHFYKNYQEYKLTEQKVIAGTASAKFETLKNQIDPHFLFNSLNVLSSLIEENPEQAQRFTTSLSKIYRYVLEQKDKELVSVEEELSFAKTYMNLLKMRFENSLSFELPIHFNNSDARVVPLSLQLLLENTIKHNVVSEKKPLYIKIFIENNYLVVENNLQKKEVLQKHKGVGLQNIINRYGLISYRKVLIQQTNTYFRVYIPILTKKIAIMETQDIYNENLAFTKAKERVEKLKSFYANLISYCSIIPFLILINSKTSNFNWFWFPLIGWGMGLFFHAIEVFGYGKNWEERKIKEILRKENLQNKKWD